jgi:hypothetical protein
MQSLKPLYRIIFAKEPDAAISVERQAMRK